MSRIILALLLLSGLAFAAAPSLAHKDHSREQVEELAPDPVQTGNMSAAEHEMLMEAHAEQLAAMEAERLWHERLLNWVGRTHPFAVHFPIALFPIAWVSLMLARRRSQSGDVIRSLVVVGGAASILATLFGWLNAGFQIADADPILLWHRWLGTALGLAGGGLAVWAWRSAGALRSRWMLWSLGLLTLGMLVQGWLGGALIHGLDHLNW